MWCDVGFVLYVGGVRGFLRTLHAPGASAARALQLAQNQRECRRFQKATNNSQDNPRANAATRPKQPESRRFRVLRTLHAPALPPPKTGDGRQFQREFSGRSTRQRRHAAKTARRSTFHREVSGRSTRQPCHAPETARKSSIPSSILRTIHASALPRTQNLRTVHTPAMPRAQNSEKVVVSNKQFSGQSTH